MKPSMCRSADCRVSRVNYFNTCARDVNLEGCKAESPHLLQRLRITARCGAGLGATFPDSERQTKPQLWLRPGLYGLSWNSAAADAAAAAAAAAAAGTAGTAGRRRNSAASCLSCPFPWLHPCPCLNMDIEQAWKNNEAHRQS